MHYIIIYLSAHELVLPPLVLDGTSLHWHLKLVSNWFLCFVVYRKWFSKHISGVYTAALNQFEVLVQYIRKKKKILPTVSNLDRQPENFHARHLR